MLLTMRGTVRDGVVVMENGYQPDDGTEVYVTLPDNVLELPSRAPKERKKLNLRRLRIATERSKDPDAYVRKMRDNDRI